MFKRVEMVRSFTGNVVHILGYKTSQNDICKLTNGAARGAVLGEKRENVSAKDGVQWRFAMTSPRHAQTSLKLNEVVS